MLRPLISILAIIYFSINNYSTLHLSTMFALLLWAFSIPLMMSIEIKKNIDNLFKQLQGYRLSALSMIIINIKEYMVHDSVHISIIVLFLMYTYSEYNARYEFNILSKELNENDII